MKTRLKQLREESSLTQEVLASYLGVEKKVYDEFEDGSSNMSVENIEKICNLYGCNEAYLFGRNNIYTSLNFSLSHSKISAKDLETIAAVNKITMNLMGIK